MHKTAMVLAQRYARAVLALAMEQRIVDQVGEQLARLSTACWPQAAGRPDRKARAFWRSQKVSAEEKRDLLQDLLERLEAETVVRNTANLLLDRGRLDILPDMTAAYREMSRELFQTAQARVASAFELGPTLRDRLREALEKMSGKTIELQVEVDPALIGGVRVRLGNLVIDGSVCGRLQHIRQGFGE